MRLYELERTGDADELIRVLREHEDESIRARAAEILGTLPDHRAREDIDAALVEAARRDSDDVAAAAIDALATLGEDAIERLVGEMADVDIRADADDRVTAAAYVNALDAEVPELRMAAATGLGELEATEAVEPLCGSFADPDPRVRARAVRAAGLIGDPRASESLEARLSDSSGTVRREAAASLGFIGSRQALHALLAMYEDAEESVRRVAVDAFGNFRNDRPVAHLVDALADDEASVRRTAVYSMLELLSNVPTARSHEVRESLAAELADRDDIAVAAPLVELLERSDEAPQRRTTAWLLGRVLEAPTEERVTDALVDAMSDEDRMVRQCAARSLAELDGDGIEDRLLAIVDDEDAPLDQRKQAVFTLGNVGDGPARDTLDSLLADMGPARLQWRALAALSKLGGRD